MGQIELFNYLLAWKLSNNMQPMINIKLNYQYEIAMLEEI